MRIFPKRMMTVFLAAVCAGLSSSETAQMWVREEAVYSSHFNVENRIALTFDDGPHPVYTPEILDLLADYGIHATFFLIGENAERYPELIARIQREGHEIGNHTYDHTYLHRQSEAAVEEAILHAENVILELCDQRPKLLRPPGGLYDHNVCTAARMLDYEVILWTIDTLDWAHTPPEKITENVLTHIASGDIILCHDAVGGKPSPTPQALAQFLPALIERGYQFVTVSELIHSG